MSAVERFAGGLGATFATEFRLRLRDGGTLLKTVLLVFFCVALVPPPGAPYAVLHVGGVAPAMSADTAMIAAAVVINAVLLLAYGLSLDVGLRRDRRGGMDRIRHTAAGSHAGVAAGRIAANAAYAALSLLLAACALASTLFARFGAPPSETAFALYWAMVLPCALAAPLLAGIAECVCADALWPRMLLTVAVWSGCLVSSLKGGLDLVGIGTLIALIAPFHDTAGLSLGFIAADSEHGFAWTTLHGTLGQWLPGRLAPLAGLLPAAVVAVALLRWRLSTPPRADNVGATAPAGRVPAATLPSHQGLPPGGRAGVLSTLRLDLLRLRRKSPVAFLACAVAFVAGIASPAPGFALSLLTMVPLLLVARTSASEIAVAALTERCEPAYARLGATLHAALAILCPIAIAALPALVRVPPVQAATALAGSWALIVWLVLSHRRLDRPMLGIAVAAAVLYVLIFNEIPAAFDILGLSAPSGVALAIASALAGALTWQSLRRQTA